MAKNDITQTSAYHTLDDKNATQDDVASTDIDMITDDTFNKQKKNKSIILDSDATPGNHHITDIGGTYSPRDVVDQDADNPPAGTEGHGGIDEDTA